MPEDSFEMIPVTSSQIASVGYQESTRQLRVEFLKNGSLYEYDSVSQDEFDNLVNAASVGQVFGATIKNIKSFRRVA